MTFNLYGTWAIYRFEMARALRTLWQSLVTPVITTSLYFVVFGAAIGRNIDAGATGGVPYGAFIVPGLIMLSLFTQSIFNASFGIFFPKFTGTIYELLSAPISPLETVIGYVGAAATKSLVLGLVILATAAFFVPIRIDHPVWMIAFLVLICVTFCLFGFIIGIWGQNFEQIQFIPMLIVTPLTCLLFGVHASRAVADNHPFQPGRLSDRRLPLELLLDDRHRRGREPGSDAGLLLPLPRDRLLDLPDGSSTEDLGRRQLPRILLLIGAAYALAVEVLGDELPVDDVAEHALGEFGPFVAVVDIISVLPYIEG
jgi:ABC-2 type transport system permease protein